ncbi:TetR/AcrR family transcriptional regulator [Flavobacterium lacus]|uniref:TetR family transcriptional regulator n=1 Tax=Flavobacterium lacus TaxID=1353778 RepID=A0A328WW95_9FLAO|nr:TetR/AcrR family transcriptional regulator [Flavobacterium lacus]RAR47568.1 TetR family transcriptional regulator [Flavobacterium lacus]
MKITDRKLEIITIAAQLFKEKGYSAVTMRDIAQAMNIKAASLYNHIKSKQEILVLIIIEIAEEFTNVMNEIVNSNDLVLTKIERVIQLHIDITLRNADALACLNNDWMHLTDDELQYFVKMRTEYEANFRKIISEGVLAGELKNCNQEVVVFSILSTLRTMYLWYNKTKDLDAQTLQNTIATVFLKGVANK